MNRTASKIAEEFFGGMGMAPGLKAELAVASHKAQFMPIEGKPFYMSASDGVLKFGEGEMYGPEMREALYITEVQPAFTEILEGRQTLGEAIFHLKVRISGYRNKEPEIGKFSLFLRRGVWAVVRAPEILKPKK